MSLLFTKTLRNAPKDEAARSAQFLLRAGFIHKQSAGVYAFLPLGLRVLENIKNIIRTEMNSIGGIEILMTALQNPVAWEKTGRWDDKILDVWFKTKLNAGGEIGLGTTHEEPITAMLCDYVQSYKDLPVFIYQFQTKFRNELRAKSGILRTREFLMKDLYSFTTDEKSHQEFYAKVEQAYKNIYQQLGIGDITHQTFASGGSFSKYSHEFQTITPVGEDTVWYNQDYSLVLNDEVFNDEVLADLGANRADFKSAAAAEVGNIFTLGLKYSDALNLKFQDQNGQQKTVFMGSYGIGVSRVLGIIAEVFADENGLVWPENIAPYQYHLIAIGDQATKIAEEMHIKHPESILFDNRDLRPGVKFADADLIGIPQRIVISDKTLEQNSAEITDRKTHTNSILTLEALNNKLSK